MSDFRRRFLGRCSRSRRRCPVVSFLIHLFEENVNGERDPVANDVFDFDDVLVVAPPEELLY